VSYSFIDYKGFPIVSPQPTGEPASQFNTAFSGVAEHVDDTTNPHFVTYTQVGAAASNHNHDSLYDASGLAGIVQNNLTSHSGRIDNPHGVTYTQAGAAASGHNHDAYYDTIGEASGVQSNLTEHSGNLTNPHQVSATQIGTYTTSQTDVLLFSHSGRLDNPHAVTYAQAGAAASNHNHNLSYDALGLAEAVQTNLTSHSGDLANPHQVTPSQIGAQSYGSYHRDITFVLGDMLEVGADQTNHVPLTASGYFQSLYTIVKTAPTGDDIVFGINKNGVAIQSAKLTILDGNTSGSSTTFSLETFEIGDYLSIDVDKIGSVMAGSDATIVLGIECM
jgi:hypothetical protein